LKGSGSQGPTDPEMVRSVFYPPVVKKDNIFFSYKPEEDYIAIQSEKDLKEVFHQMNEILEIKK
jgi:hypothetical protein